MDGIVSASPNNEDNSHAVEKKSISVDKQNEGSEFGNPSHKHKQDASTRQEEDYRLPVQEVVQLGPKIREQDILSSDTPTDADSPRQYSFGIEPRGKRKESPGEAHHINTKKLRPISKPISSSFDSPNVMESRQNEIRSSNLIDDDDQIEIGNDWVSNSVDSIINESEIPGIPLGAIGLPSASTNSPVQRRNEEHGHTRISTPTKTIIAQPEVNPSAIDDFSEIMPPPDSRNFLSSQQESASSPRCKEHVVIPSIANLHPVTAVPTFVPDVESEVMIAPGTPNMKNEIAEKSADERTACRSGNQGEERKPLKSEANHFISAPNERVKLALDISTETAVTARNVSLSDTTKTPDRIDQDQDSHDQMDGSKVTHAPNLPNNKSSTATDSEAAPTSESKAKERIITKANRKILRGRKEEDHADALLAGKIDLTRVICMEDCKFLSNLWIFTLDQLEFTLSGSEIDQEFFLSEHASRQGAPYEELFTMLVKSEILRSDSSADSNETSSLTISEHDSRILAVKKMRHWKKQIAEWKTLYSGETPSTESQFLLSGPLSILFPPYARNFLASAAINFARNFLCLKKTETGIIIDFVRVWRRLCNLPALNPLSIAKHMLGLSFRLEKALGSMPPADKFTRSWVGGPLVVLSGAGKDFLIGECKMDSESDLIDTRTKDISTKLVEWRAARGMPVLKGTGKVAMVSAWKSAVKEAIDVESQAGKVIHGVNFEAEIQKETPFVKEKKIKPAKTKAAAPESDTKETKKPRNTKCRVVSGRTKLSSPRFSSILPETELEIIQSVGIITVQDLLGAVKSPDSPLVMALAKFKSPPAEADACVALISSWCLEIQSIVESSAKMGLEKDTKNTKLSTIDTPPPVKAESNSHAYTNIRPNPAKDPFMTISATNQSFLRSISITTAEQLLSTRTTDIGKKYKIWRDQENMRVLKGQGAIASVSSWKTHVRKAAEELGAAEEDSIDLSDEDDLSDKTSKRLAPIDTTPSTLLLKSMASVKLRYDLPEVTDKSLALFGITKHQFSVRGTFGQHYRFQLSIRKSDIPFRGNSVYLTFLGSFVPDATIQKILSGAEGRDAFGDSVGVRDEVFPVLQDTSDLTLPMTESLSPFSSIMFGSGAIELSKYGLQQTINDSTEFKILNGALSKLLSPTCIKNAHNEIDPASTFLSSDIGNWQLHTTSHTDQETNVFARFGRCSFLWLVRPIEKGQTVELCFPDFLSKTPSNAPEQINFRVSILRSISQMSTSGLREVRGFLENLQQKHEDDTTPEPGANGRNYLSLFRRRLYWAILKINSRLDAARQNADQECHNEQPDQNILQTTGRWTSRMAKQFFSIGDEVFDFLRTETKLEILSELCSSDFGDFALSKAIWCPLGKRVFVDTFDLMASFVAGLDNYCSEEELVRRICAIVTRESKTIADLVDKKQSYDDLQDIFLTFSRSESHSSGIFPKSSDVWNECLHCDYGDPMALCGDQIGVPEKFFAVATQLIASNADNNCTEPSSTNTSTFCMRNPDICDIMKLKLHKKFYVERQVTTIASAVVRCGVALISEPFKFPHLNEIESKLCIAATQACEMPKIEIFSLGSNHSMESIRLPFDLGSPPFQKRKPPSYQLFLAIVWPTLADFGWKLEGGDEPESIKFFLPGQYRSEHSKIRLWKQNRAKRRAELSKQTRDLGLGHISKDTKRIFISSTSGEEKGTGRHLAGQSVKGALKLFQADFIARTSTGDSHLRMLDQIVDHLCICFDKAFPMLLHESEVMDIGGGRPSEVCGCEFLMRLFIIMPNFLQQADLPRQQIDDSIGVIRDISEYITNNNRSLFREPNQIPEEILHRQPPAPQYLAPRLAHFSSGKSIARSNGKNGSQVKDELRDVVLDTDRATLTDFLSVCMDQTCFIRAAEEDLMRKNRGRNVSLGYAGLACRHCLGTKEGRYFFSSNESMATASTVIEKHLIKCSRVPQDIKDTLTRNKGYHTNQRKHLPLGSQGAFFARLWKRMTSSKNLPADPIHISGQTFNKLGVSSDPSNCSLPVDSEPEHEPKHVESQPKVGSFTCHIRLVYYLQSAAPWDRNREIAKALDQYYACLEYGGRVYNTNQMPVHFSSEWFLSKVLPRKTTEGGVKFLS